MESFFKGFIFVLGVGGCCIVLYAAARIFGLGVARSWRDVQEKKGEEDE